MQIRAIEEGLRVLEVPVSYRCRIGTSKVSGTIRGSVLAGSKILYVIGRLRASPANANARDMPGTSAASHFKLFRKELIP